MQTLIAFLATVISLKFDVISTTELSGRNAYPWPYPQNILTDFTFFSLNSDKFEFVLKETHLKECEVLKSALERYKKLVFLKGCHMLGDKSTDIKMSAETVDKTDPNYLGELQNLTIQIRSKCETIPSADMDEMYTLRVNSPDFPGQAFLFANSVWGAIRGLETFSQLLYSDENSFFLNTTFILDYPRFNHRGMLLDTSRHYISVKKLLENLDAMAYNKLNVFHWHIVDDPSFPFVSRTFPELNRKGAFRSTHVYTPEDVNTVIEHARKLGIRVMVEFDTPGHTQSWGKGQPDLLTRCYDKGKPIDSFGPIDPTKSKNYKFLENFFAEVSQTFPEEYLHLGGDEVDFTCWKSNPQITDFMKNMSFGSDYAKLESYYIQKLVNLIDRLNRSSVVWQEVFDNGVQLPKTAIVHVWKGDTSEEYHNELKAVTAAGHRALISSPWYLSNIVFGSDWKGYYDEDPTAFDGTEQQKNLVIGGEVCMWGEYIDGTNLIPRTWPRAAPVAERLWSPQHITSIEKAIPRLNRMQCLLMQRGIHAQPPNGPSFCPCDYAV